MKLNIFELFNELYTITFNNIAIDRLKSYKKVTQNTLKNKGNLNIEISTDYDIDNERLEIVCNNVNAAYLWGNSHGKFTNKVKIKNHLKNLESQSFEGWSKKEIKGYKTAVKSILGYIEDEL